MPELVELSSSTHKDLRLVENAQINLAKSQQIIKIRANEASKAATSFPLFFTRGSSDGDWGLTVLSSLHSGHNMFVENEQWQANYQPSIMQTYPLFLMQSAKGENSYTVGINPDSDAFSTSQGEALFDETGQASLFLSRAKNILEANIQHDIASYHFIEAVKELDLFKEVELALQYQDDTAHNLTGVYTIDEDKLNSLNAEQLVELNKKGYLVQLHAILMSIHQLNSLVRIQNKRADLPSIKHLKIQLPRQSAVA